MINEQLIESGAELETERFDFSLLKSLYIYEDTHIHRFFFFFLQIRISALIYYSTVYIFRFWWYQLIVIRIRSKCDEMCAHLNFSFSFIHFEFPTRLQPFFLCVFVCFEHETFVWNLFFSHLNFNRTRQFNDLKNFRSILILILCSFFCM